MEQKKRIAYIDLAKLWAIFCVIWGHGFFFATTDHPINTFIMSCNMPLFMIMSGLFASRVLKLSFIEMLKAKVSQLLIPMLLWTFIGGMLFFLRSGGNLSTGLMMTRNLFMEWNWFMPSIFICFLLYYVTNRLLENIPIGRFLSLLLSWLIIWLIPFPQNWHLDHMIFYFFFGSYIKPLLLDRELKPIYTWVMLAIFSVLLYCWDTSNNLYRVVFRPLSIEGGVHIDWHNIALNIYQTALGVSGALSLLLIFRLVEQMCKKGADRLALWGKETLGLYLMHLVILDTMIALCLRFVPSLEQFLCDKPWLGDFLFFAPVAQLCVVICLVIIRQIRRSRLLSRLLLGS